MGRMKSNLGSSSKDQKLFVDNIGVVSLELKMKGLLKELHKMIKHLHEERERGESNLSNIQKTHERIQQEVKVSPYFKSKLKSLCTNALQDSENEVSLIRQALEKIEDVRACKEDANQSSISSQNNSSYNSKNNTIYPVSNHSNSSNNKSGKKQIVRKGVLMSSLQQDAMSLSMWHSKTAERPPPLCGSTPAENNYVAKVGDKVAARVKGEEENWILAEVVSFGGGAYEVDDVDADEGNQRHLLSRRRVVPLPIWKANPQTDPSALFTTNTLVMALYPQTTCFYRALIHEPPKKADDEYSVLFEDTSYPDGYSPPLLVPQKYVIFCKQQHF